MQSMKHGFLAAAAAVALIAGTGGAFAQADKKMDVQAQGQTSGSAKKQQSSGPGDTVQGGAKTGTSAGAGMDKKDGAAGVQAQGEATGSVKKQQSSGPGDTVQGGAKTGTSASDSDKEDGMKSGQAQRESGDQDSARDSQASKSDVKLSQEQRTQISRTIKQKDVNLRSVSRTEVNFQINVGTSVPRSFTFYPLPAPIISVVPEYRGYLYIVVDNQLLIIHPETYVIVAVIPA